MGRHEGEELISYATRQDHLQQCRNATDCRPSLPEWWTKVFFAAAEPLLRIETPHQNSKDLLLLTDRFGAAMIPFLLQHYHIVDAVNMELAAGTDWKSLTNGTYSQILILCGADTVTAPDGLAAMLTDAPPADESAAVSDK